MVRCEAAHSHDVEREEGRPAQNQEVSLVEGRSAIGKKDKVQPGEEG